jgi:hypothetical protein
MNTLTHIPHAALLELASLSTRHRGPMADVAAAATLTEIKRRQAARAANMLHWVAYLEARRN